MGQPNIEQQIRLDGKIVCITGGAGGIGTAIGETVASLGADVAIADVAEEEASENARKLEEKYDVNAIAVETDVTAYDDAQEMVETIEGELGSIGILVNNAGIARAKSFIETEPADWDTLIGVAQYGTLNCTHAALPAMIARGEGVVINFASGSYRGNDPRLSIYGAAKAANVSFTKTLAKEVGSEGIRVNCVSPGTVRTQATEEWIDNYEDSISESYALKRVGEPQEVANIVALLASDIAGWVTGEVVHVDGGYLRR
jgi:NAD(P)-dependent dehydrogenase (short-subunit alcohol dehydrogenase family)